MSSLRLSNPFGGVNYFFLYLSVFSARQRKKNYSTYGWFILKLLLALLALRFIYSSVIHQDNSGNYLSQMRTALSLPGAVMMFAGVMLLMLVNWITEAWKWRLMMSKLENISMLRSLAAVFSGLTISIFTPNRIGEFAGRVFHLEKADKVKATLITIIENSSQLIITFVAGMTAMIFYFSRYTEMSNPFIALLAVLSAVASAVVLLSFLNVRFLENIFRRLRLPEKWQQTIHVFALYSRTDLIKVLAGALLRYVVFSLQFFMLIRFYGGNAGFRPAMLMIVMTFFIIAVVPTFTLTEIGIRGAVAAYFFTRITIDILPVLNAVFTLWIINLALPALIGAFAVLNFHFEKKKE